MQYTYDEHRKWQDTGCSNMLNANSILQNELPFILQNEFPFFHQDK